MAAGALENKLARETPGALRGALAGGNSNEAGTETYDAWFEAFGELVSAPGTEHGD